MVCQYKDYLIIPHYLISGSLFLIRDSLRLNTRLLHTITANEIQQIPTSCCGFTAIRRLLSLFVIKKYYLNKFKISFPISNVLCALKVLVKTTTPTCFSFINRM